MMHHHHAAVEETLQQLVISPKEIKQAVEQHISGGNAAYELMRLGQEVGFFHHSRLRVSIKLWSNSAS